MMQGDRERRALRRAHEGSLKAKRGRDRALVGARDAREWVADLLAGFAAAREAQVALAPDPGPPESYREKQARWMRESVGAASGRNCLRDPGQIAR